MATTFIWVFSDSGTIDHKVRVTAELEYLDWAAGVKTISSSATLGVLHNSSPPPPPGCPILHVYDGIEYVSEGLLDIHDPDGVDVTADHTLVATPQRVDGAYLFRLVEHQKTHSYIDQVKLYAMLEDGTRVQLPLIWARHSEDGNVLPQLHFSDDWKTDTLGANLNNGVSESIDLKFAALPSNMEASSFVFQIEGNNMLPK